MHYHLEIILPPSNRPAEDDVKAVMESFFREPEGDDENEEHTADWWDWYQIGGRWSGEHGTSHIPQERLDAFIAQLTEKKFTVCGLIAGKQTLSPASQIPAVDVLWRESFPGQDDECPLFDHAKPAGDVTTYGKISENLSCARLILCDRDDAGAPRVVRMQVDSIWNGTEHQDTTFDGSVRKFIEAQRVNERRWPPALDVKDDWTIITVDYHN